METLLRAFDLTAALNSRGISFASLGAAYLVFIGTCIATAALFSAARKHLVVAPNRQSRNYALYVIAVLCTLLIATALENELSAAAVPTLRYVAYPQIALLLALHIWIAYRTEPWLIQLGASSLVGSALVAASAAAATESFRDRARRRAARDRRAARLPLVRRNLDEARVRGGRVDLRALEGEPRRGRCAAEAVARCAALRGARRGELALAVANSLLRGRGLEEIPAVDVAVESGVLDARHHAGLRSTRSDLLVRAQGVDAGANPLRMARLDRRRFRFTYGNYLTSLAKT